MERELLKALDGMTIEQKKELLSFLRYLSDLEHKPEHGVLNRETEKKTGE